MRLARTLLILSAVGFLAADDPKKEEADSLKGKWSAVSILAGGKPEPDEVVKGFKFTIDDKTYTNLMGTQVVEEGGYKIDASKSPKTIDFEIKKGPDVGKRQLGIYKIEADKLTIVVAQAGSEERPKSFKVDPESTLLEIVLVKAKP
jgi:uncharacterized protein (TIGR03067 family)